VDVLIWASCLGPGPKAFTRNWAQESDCITSCSALRYNMSGLGMYVTHERTHWTLLGIFLPCCTSQ